MWPDSSKSPVAVVVLGESNLIGNAGSSSGDFCERDGLQFPRLGPTLILQLNKWNISHEIQHRTREAAERAPLGAC